MKKILALILLSIATVSCYDSYIYDFTYTGVYFPYQMDVRTFVVGEGMKIEVGAALGGTRENTIDRNVTFTLDNTLITPARLSLMKAASQPYIKNPSVLVKTLNLLPADYYTISNSSTMVIKAGQHMGSVIIKPDSVKFLNDSLKTLNSAYALPFRITAADADSIKFDKKTNIVGVRYENMLFGNYWHGGAAIISKKNQPTVDSITVAYRWAVNDIASKIWTLTTVGPNTLLGNGFFNQTTTRNELKMVLKGNNVYISAVPAIVANPLSDPEVVAKLGSSYPFVADGVGTFNRAKKLQDRKIFLKYNFVNAGRTYHCTDTLIFRNRIRDGVNEWQDENPSHYTK